MDLFFNTWIGTINTWEIFSMHWLAHSTCRNIFNALIGTFNAWNYFLMRGLVQSTRGKYFQCFNWHNQHVEVFFNELIVTFNE